MESAQVFQKRRAGVLLHLTSLPSANLGSDAYKFIDFLKAASVSLWQMLPLGPTHNDGSPYQCLSAHAGNTDFICLETAKHASWSDPNFDLGNNRFNAFSILYSQYISQADDELLEEFHTFCSAQKYWLEDFVLFCEIREQYQNKAWFQWPEKLRDRNTEALNEISTTYSLRLNERRFAQFLFFKQWGDLKQYANQHGVNMFGDMPIFVAHDSADVWANPNLFTLDDQGSAEKVAGVPPDYFSETGQRWGNPLYRWEKHTEQNYLWWQQRMQTQLQLFDLIRIDHFRGFEACWEIPASCETAIDGEWVKAPGDDLFQSLVTHFGELPLVAEDLGIITDEVTALREKFAMPGMKILQFSFGDDAANPYLPHNHTVDSVSYTGTHDNNTTLGWFNELDDFTKSRIYEYFGQTNESMPWLLIRACLQSVSALSIIPMQDILSLDQAHRMNVPGTVEGNWKWQFSWEMFHDTCAPRLKKLNDLYGRS